MGFAMWEDLGMVFEMGQKFGNKSVAATYGV
jgi:hypothetical protein